MSNAAKSIVAVAVGFVAIVMLSIGADLVMRSLHFLPQSSATMSNRQFVLAFFYRTLISIFGCYFAARLAPNHPMKHALWLGVIGLVFSAIGIAASYSHPELGPHWYPIALLIVTLPCAYAGGKVAKAKSKQSHVATNS